MRSTIRAVYTCRSSEFKNEIQRRLTCIMVVDSPLMSVVFIFLFKRYKIRLAKKNIKDLEPCDTVLAIFLAIDILALLVVPGIIKLKILTPREMQIIHTFWFLSGSWRINTLILRQIFHARARYKKLFKTMGFLNLQKLLREYVT